MAVRVHLKPFFGDLTLKEICPEHVDTFKAVKLREGKAPVTINKQLVILGSMMKRAVVWRYIRENPVQYVSRVKQIRHEMDYLTPDEISRLLEVASPDYLPVFATTYATPTPPCRSRWTRTSSSSSRPCGSTVFKFGGVRVIWSVWYRPVSSSLVCIAFADYFE